MRRFFALSRTSHALLDMAAPAACALIWLGRFPPWRTTAISLATAFAAYAAIYALNDLLGIKCDREKFAGAHVNRGYSVEASPMRHPLARGLLSFRSGLLWTGAWLVIALLGCYLLNPAIVWVLLAAAGLEASYCLLQNVSCWRTLVSGLVKIAGPLAAVLVVDPNPSLAPLLLLLAWLFFWEIGGQNIPSDWNYTDEDRRANAQTIPIRLGLAWAGALILAALIASMLAGALLPLVSPARLGWMYVVPSLVLGYFLLLSPAYRLYRLQAPPLAARLFDHASYYPLSQLLLVSLLVGSEMLRGG